MNRKIRYDLVPQHGLTEVCKVLTAKLDRYEMNEWKKGLPWMDALSTMKKHLTEFELGNDFTSEGNLHMAEVANQALIICEYYNIYPQGDNRIIAPLNKPKIALDLDGVIFDFNKAYEERFNVKLNHYWNGHYDIGKHLKELEGDKDFWLNLEVLNRPSFEVDYYVTSRSIPVEWIEESLQIHGLPCAPVHNVPWNTSKLDHLKNLKVDIFVDDKNKIFFVVFLIKISYICDINFNITNYENRKIFKPNTNFRNMH